MNFLRFVAAVLVGAVAAFACVMVVEVLFQRVCPPSDAFLGAAEELARAFQSGDREAIAAARQALGAEVAAIPLAAKWAVIGGWTLAVIAGGGIAALLAGRAPVAASLVVAAFVVIGIVANAVLIPHPTWMSVIGPVLVASGGLGTGLCVRDWTAARAARAAVRKAAAGAAPR